jgi:hypothetical protein
MEDLKQWLDNPSRDYFVGVRLYEKYGEDIRLKMRVFPAGPFANNQKLLHYELDKEYKRLAKQPAPAATHEKQQAPPPSIPLIPKETPRAPEEGYLRKEFPKLDFKNLPDDLKILVIDSRATWHQAQEAREKKFAAESDEERLKWNIIEIENRMENRLIWEELNHYQLTGKILGKHPRFERMKALEKLQQLTRAELMNKKKHFPPSISKAKKAIRDAAGDEELVLKKQALLAKYEWQEKEVDRLLGI